jgi:hypothetical protein
MIQIINNDGSYVFPNQWQISFANYYEQVKGCMDTFTKKAYGKEIMGHTEVQNEYDKINNIHYLGLYMAFIVEDIAMDVANGVALTTEEYVVKYKLECIRKAIQCTGCSVEIAIGTLDTLCTAGFDMCGTIQSLVNYFKCP